MNVAPAKRNITIAGLQTALVIERSAALARRAPVLRLALNRAAAVRVEIVSGRKPVVDVRVQGAAGANVITLPTKALAGCRRAATGSSSRHAARRARSRCSACRSRSARSADAQPGGAGPG